MSHSKISVRPFKAIDETAVKWLHASAFGPGRFARTAYRIREAAAHKGGIDLVAPRKKTIAGAIHFTPVAVGESEFDVLLLGPLAVDQRYRNCGYGRKLIGRGLEVGKANGFRLVILVGDLAYYGKLGFVRFNDGQIEFPGPVDSQRLLYAELRSEAVNDYRGMVRGV